MRQLAGYLKKYRRECILGPLFKMLEASFELFVPLVMAKLIDVGISGRDTAYILKMAGLLVLLALIGLSCSLTAQYFAAKAAVGSCTDIRNDLYAHINRLSYRELDKIGTSTLITRMTSDINQVQAGVNMSLRLFLRSPFIVLGAMIMAFTVNVKAALVFAVAIPLLSLVVFGIMLITMPLYKKVQRLLDRVTLTTRENLTGARVIRAFNRQEQEIRTFEESNRVLVAAQVFVGKISALMNPVTYVMINLAIAAVIWIGANQVSDGVITQGQTVALINYMSQILVELVKLASLIISLSKSIACMNRVFDVFNEQSEMADGRGVAASRSEDQEAVRFSQVYFNYQGTGGDALLDLDFCVEKGQTVGIIGGTGSGKTSLVNLIPRFYDVREGTVYVDGEDVRNYTLHQLRSKVGIVPQKAVLFKGSLRDNMKWGCEEATDDAIYRALDMAQAREFVDAKGEGLEMEIGQGGKNLSGGQRQRLTIARALVRNPAILILDDSASALDFATDAKLRKAIREETGGMTVFLVSQRAASVKQADQILVLDDGRMADRGTHTELLERCELYREICLSQLSAEEVQG